MESCIVTPTGSRAYIRMGNRSRKPRFEFVAQMLLKACRICNMARRRLWPKQTASTLSQKLELPNRPPGRHRLGGRDDRPGVEAVVTVKLGDGAGLAEMLDSEGAGAVTGD
jgi:hypothetical protein